MNDFLWNFVLPLGLLLTAVWLAVKLYRLRVRAANDYYDRLLRQAKETENTVLDAAWRAQLDREQLFRDYVRMEVQL